MKTLFTSLAALLIACAGSLAHGADAYPSKPIKLIVPYAVGQGTDIAARFVGDELSKELKQPIFVDNRPGAGGNVGTQIAARSPADGYTLMIGTNATHAANAFLYVNPGFDPQADFEPIAMVGILPLVYVTSPTNPISNIPDMVRAARAKPDALNIAVSTNTCRMAHELFKLRAKASMFPVDYKGSAQAITAVMAKEVDYMVDTISSLRTPILNGQVKALGVTSAHSSQLLPGVKSAAEQGVDGYELVGWTVLYAPKGMSAEAERTLAAAMNKVLARKDVQDKLLQLGIDPLAKSGAELKTFVAAEKDKWGRLVKLAGLQPS
jgi:tripartite-type tricarboxylate transporter receptor subunit TctC